MVSLIFNRIHQCGGVVIDNLHVVTAAHCVIERHPNPRIKVQHKELKRNKVSMIFAFQPNELTIRVGTNFRHNTNVDTDPAAKFYEVIEIWPHR